MKHFKIRHPNNNKKNVLDYHIYDGFIRYNVSLSPKITCQCSNKKLNLCDHAVSLLRDYFGLSEDVIQYLHHFYDKFIEMVIKNNTDINNLLSIELANKLSSEQCAICLNTLSTQKELKECDMCHNIQHKKCMDRWKKNCIICRS